MAKVLVVDDSAFMRSRNVSLLKGLGHETLEAGDGNEAVESYKQNKPDAVLMDITMPGMDGLEALKVILAHDPNAKIAMVTAMGQQSIIMDAIKNGAKDFVVKPFEKERVLEAVEKLLA